MQLPDDAWIVYLEKSKYKKLERKHKVRHYFKYCKNCNKKFYPLGKRSYICRKCYINSAKKRIILLVKKDNI